MKNQQQVIIHELKSVLNEIDRLKLMIKNLNNRAISNSDKMGVLAFLNQRKARLILSSSLISPVVRVGDNDQEI